MNYNYMIKRVFFVLGCLFSGGVSVYAQSAVFSWVKQVAQYSQATANAVDKDGNVYTIGYFQMTADFDPGPNTFPMTDPGGALTSNIYILKLDSAGDFVWAKQIGKSFSDRANAICLDSSGNIYIAGRFVDTVDFDPGAGSTNLASNGGLDIFILKLNPSGNFIWAKSMGGSANDAANSIKIDSSSNLCITGYFNNTVDFNPGSGGTSLTSNGGTDIFVLKMDVNGNFVWAKSVGGSGADLGQSIAHDAGDNLYITGSYNATVDFNPGSGVTNLTSNGAGDIFVLKLDANGNFVWVKSMGSAGGDVGYGIAADAIGNSYITGSFIDTVDFDPGTGVSDLISNGAFTDIFVQKLDSSGNYVWAKSIGGERNDRGTSITLDDWGNIYTTGYFCNTANFNPGGAFNLTAPGNITSQNIFISILDNTGDFVWAGQMGGTGNDQGTSIALSPYGDIYTVGYLNGANGDFDPGLGTIALNVSNGASFIHKMNKNFCTNTFFSITQTECDSFTLNGQTYTSSGSYNQTLPNAQGCDSIITLNLTINRSTVNTPIFRTACDSFTLNGQTYKQSGSYTQTYPNAVGCDSIIALNLVVNNSSAATITRTDCDSFELGDSTYIASGTYTYITQNATGCDSVITLHLTINKSIIHELTETACDSYTLNGETYTATGIYTQHHFTTNDCDSTVILDLTINSSPAATITAAGPVLTASSGDNYQWLDCGQNFSIISGATGVTFSASEDGSYAVVVTQDGCSDTSDCYELKGTNINEHSLSGNINIYPNPVVSSLSIKSGMVLQDATVRLVNILGQVVMSNSGFRGKETILDMGRFDPGIYMVEIIEGGKIYRTKVIKK